MIRNVEDTFFEQFVTIYEKYRPHHQSMAFEEVIFLFLEDTPIETDSEERSFEHSGSDEPSYLYPMHGVTHIPYTYLERLDFQMPVSVDWPPTLKCVPSFNLHMNTIPTITIGPLTEYVFIFMLSI